MLFGRYAAPAASSAAWGSSRGPSVVVNRTRAIWLSGSQPIGHRPLLAFGVLSMLVGVQFFAVGLLSELVLSYQTRTDDVSIRRRLG